jgi:hypothetical protein
VLLAAALVKACALLTAADVASVMGEKPGKKRESTPQPHVSRCVVALPSSKSLSLEARQGAQAAEAAERLRRAAEVEKDEAGEDEDVAVEVVSDLGDEAFWARGDGGLYVRCGATLLRMTIGGNEGEAAKRDRLRLLAVKVLGRLPGCSRLETAPTRGGRG